MIFLWPYLKINSPARHSAGYSNYQYNLPHGTVRKVLDLHALGVDSEHIPGNASEPND